MSAFWRAYFGAFCASLVLFGAVLCAGAFAPTSGPVSLLIKTLSGGNAANFEPALRFSLGLMGALTIGWAVMIYGVMRVAFTLGPQGRPLWDAITAGLISWYVIDGICSIATGFALNIIPNTALAAMYLVGLTQSGALKR
ncbi:MAG TPA: hypothetical protein DIU09_11330 [Hyphomonadaceae bacterium]|nr:hypothetical protein AEM38_06550 [Hyphomonadaceae bacterium UKL13-1]HCP65169.1 hypothetical protein [Hyphomonadaceae bacterium]